MRHSSWVVFVAILALTGCATIIRGSTDTLTITSEPAGARIVSDIARKAPTGGSDELDWFYGCPATPCEIEIPRDSFGKFTVTLAGYQSISYRVVSSATTSNDVFVPGTLIAGLPPGTHVVVADPKPGTQIGLRPFSSAIADDITNATFNIVPQAVTIYLAPESDVSLDDEAQDDE